MFQNRTVLALSFADAFSTLGDQVGLIALLWLVMTKSHNATDMGILALLFGIPGIVSGPIAGIFMDGWSRKWTVVLANMVQCTIFFLIAGFSSGRTVPISLYILVFVAGLFIPPTSIGSFVMIADNVGKDQLLQANALNELFSQVPLVIGPVVGGWLISMGGIRIALALDGVSFFLAAWATLWVPNDHSFTDTVRSHASKQFLFKPILRSLVFILKTPVVLWITLIALMMNGADGVLEVALPLVIHKQLHLSATLLGTVWMAYAIGTAMGAFLNTVVHISNTHRRVMVAMIIGWGVVMIVTGLMATMWSLLIGFGLAGVSFGAYPPMARTIVQSAIPHNSRGQIFSVRSSILGMGVPIGAFLSGLANTYVPASMIICFAGLSIGILGLLVWAFRLIDQPDPVT